MDDREPKITMENSQNGFIDYYIELIKMMKNEMNEQSVETGENETATMAVTSWYIDRTPQNMPAPEKKRRPRKKNRRNCGIPDVLEAGAPTNRQPNYDESMRGRDLITRQMADVTETNTQDDGDHATEARHLPKRKRRFSTPCEADEHVVKNHCGIGDKASDVSEADFEHGKTQLVTTNPLRRQKSRNKYKGMANSLATQASLNLHFKDLDKSCEEISMTAADIQLCQNETEVADKPRKKRRKSKKKKKNDSATGAVACEVKNRKLKNHRSKDSKKSKNVVKKRTENTRSRIGNKKTSRSKKQKRKNEKRKNGCSANIFGAKVSSKCQQCCGKQRVKCSECNEFVEFAQDKLTVKGQGLSSINAVCRLCRLEYQISRLENLCELIAARFSAAT